MKLLLFLLACAFAITSLHAEFDHKHSLFSEILRANAFQSSVDYEALHEDLEPLGSYISSLQLTDKAEFDQWTEKQQIAFLINLYNASTLQLIVDNSPVKSIRDITDPWKQKRIRLFGTQISLDHIEHEILRKNYAEPRIHFGLNCASIGCPPLRDEAFRAADLDQQLDEQTKAFLNDSSKNRVDLKTSTLHLSPIFDWFKEDFIKSAGSVQKFITPYLEESTSKTLKSKDFKIEYTDYDWSLNQI